MKEITIGTTNEAKVKQIRGTLLPLGIAVTGMDDKGLLPDVKEDGTTAQENARKKAIAYAQALNKVVLSMDNALYLNGLADSEQPGINVRRINNRTDRPSDQELLEYYSKKVEDLGGNIEGHWKFAICVATPMGNIKETTIESPRIFTSKVSSVNIPGYPLESIQIDPVSKKYISEMSQNEQDIFWQKMIGQQLCDFVASLEF